MLSTWISKILSGRINILDISLSDGDVVDLIEQTSDRLDQIMIPKMGCGGDIYAVDALVTAAEAATGKTNRIDFEVIIESAAGIAHVQQIVASSPCLVAISLEACRFRIFYGLLSACRPSGVAARRKITIC